MNTFNESMINNLTISEKVRYGLIPEDVIDELLDGGKILDFFSDYNINVDDTDEKGLTSKYFNPLEKLISDESEKKNEEFINELDKLKDYMQNAKDAIVKTSDLFGVMEDIKKEVDRIIKEFSTGSNSI